MVSMDDRNNEQGYLNLMSHVLRSGEFVGDRTGTGVLSIFGDQLRFDMETHFNLFTTKKIRPANIIGELLWMLSGSNDLVSLRHYQDKKPGSKTIWSDDFEKYWDAVDRYYGDNRSTQERREESGGAIYGVQWRRSSVGGLYAPDRYEGKGHFDQIKTLLDNIVKVKLDPQASQGRRLKVTSWRPFDMLEGDKRWVALPSCHTDFQVIVRNGRLDLGFDMRSSDVFLGLPYNITFYNLLGLILAKLTGLKPGELVYSGKDIHIYSNHTEVCRVQINRAPLELPTITLPEFETLDDVLKLTAGDFTVNNYQSYEALRAPQAS